MAFLCYLCSECFGSRARRSPNKPITTRVNSVGANLSEQNLLGITMGKGGGRAASKAPLMAALASSPPTGRKGFDESGLQKRHFTGARINRADSAPVFSKIGVKETVHANRHEDEDGNKMINEYVRVCKIGTGSYGKVVLHRSRKNNQLYAIKIFHKSRLRKLRVAPAETAMMDVLREVAIMKKLDHPNIVKLIEVIDDPESDYLFLVLEYVENKWVFEGQGPPGGIGEAVARPYFKDVVAGLSYLHRKNIVHGDIKPENLLIGRDGRIKICDFGVSQLFQDGNDELRRSPGTPVYTAPECCLGVTYNGKAADIWALGCTLYCMVLGRYPFVGSSLESTYDRIVNDEVWYPTDMDPDLLNLLRSLLCKDPRQRLPLNDVARHPWVSKAVKIPGSDPLYEI